MFVDAALGMIPLAEGDAGWPANQRCIPLMSSKNRASGTGQATRNVRLGVRCSPSVADACGGRPRLPFFGSHLCRMAVGVKLKQLRRAVGSGSSFRTQRRCVCLRAPPHFDAKVGDTQESARKRVACSIDDACKADLQWHELVRRGERSGALRSVLLPANPLSTRPRRRQKQTESVETLLA